MRASFDVKQPKVKIIKSDEKVYIFICLDEEEGKIEKNDNNMSSNESQVSSPNWSYNYREIVCDEDEIDLNDVQLNPEKYFDWQHSNEKSLKERFEELKEVNSELITCLSELL